MAYNRVILQGNLTKDNDLQYLPNGNAVLRNTVAVTERYKKKDGSMVETTFFGDFDLFRSAEVFNQYTKKGSKVLIEGKLRTDTWGKDGKMNYRTVISVDNFTFLDSKEQTTDTKPTLTQARNNIPEINIEEDLENNEIPF